MAETSSSLRQQLIQLSEPVRESLSRTTYEPSESNGVCIKSELLSLIPSSSIISEQRGLRAEVRDFALCCALLSSSSSATSCSSSSALVSWIPTQLAIVANNAFTALAAVVYSDSAWEQSIQMEQFGVELGSVLQEDERLVIDLMPDLLPLIKETIKNSSVDSDADGDEISAASARTPVAYAVVAARQFRWFVTKRLYKQGARNYWIHNTGPIGCLPILVANSTLRGRSNSNLDELGCIKSFNLIAQEFNNLLRDKIASLRSQLKNVWITYVDIYSARYALTRIARKLGFKEPLGSCCRNGTCCSKPGEYISWDTIHFTEAANRWVSTRTMKGDFCDPHVPITAACVKH